MADKADPDKPEKEKFWRVNNPIAYGIVISAALIGAYLMLGFQTKCIANVCETNFQRFFEADPNEIGDTLAGLFAALAFVWIIVTVFIQSHELREQRKEFSEQRKATQEMAKVMDVQAAIFKEEQSQRRESYADQQAIKLHRVLRNLVLGIFSKHADIVTADDEVFSLKILDEIEKRYSSGAEVKKQDALTLLSHFLEALSKALSKREMVTATSDDFQIRNIRSCLSDFNYFLSDGSIASQRELSLEEFVAAEDRLFQLLGSP